MKNPLNYFQFILYASLLPVFTSLTYGEETTTQQSKQNNAVYKLAGEFVDIPGGSFDMGCNAERLECNNSEIPLHRVTIKSFRFGKYEVTQAVWRNIMGADPSYFHDCDNCPVENISWFQIQDFIKTLNQKTGGTYRLPSEAEWEYVCRGGNNIEAYCGSNDPDEIAWYRNNSQNKTHPVGQKKPNRFGLYDMSGNVWEWVQDCVHFSYKGAPSDGTAWESSGDCGQRVYRGGSWDDKIPGIRSTNRTGDKACCQKNYIGFRLLQEK